MIEEIKKWIKDNSSNKLQSFSNGLIPNSAPIYGVKIPILRQKAKEICKTDFESFLKECDKSSLEITLLEAYVIAQAKMSFEQRTKYLDDFVPHIGDWAVNDGLVSSLKCIKKDLASWYQYILKYQFSIEEFEVRFLCIVLMSYYLVDDYIDNVLNLLKTLQYNGYYAKMGVAWLLATSMAKYETKTLKLLEEYKFDKEIINMTISKIRQSFRVSDETKDYVLKFKN